MFKTLGDSSNMKIGACCGSPSIQWKNQNPKTILTGGPCCSGGCGGTMVSSAPPQFRFKVSPLTPDDACRNGDSDVSSLVTYMIIIPASCIGVLLMLQSIFMYCPTTNTWYSHTGYNLFAAALFFSTLGLTISAHASVKGNEISTSTPRQIYTEHHSTRKSTTVKCDVVYSGSNQSPVLVTVYDVDKVEAALNTFLGPCIASFFLMLAAFYFSYQRCQDNAPTVSINQDEFVTQPPTPVNSDGQIHGNPYSPTNLSGPAVFTLQQQQQQQYNQSLYPTMEMAPCKSNNQGWVKDTSEISL
eukprot:PhF_6_TR30545/c0_g1_i1/m.44833